MKTIKILHSITILVALSSVVFTSEIATARPRKVAVGAGVNNLTGQDKTDFHVKISSDTNINVTNADIKDPSGNIMGGTIGGNNSPMVTVDWNVNVNQGQRINWRVIFTQEEENKYNITEAYFTPRQSPTDVPIPGWRVEADGDVFLTNEFVSGINFNNLLFQFPSDITGDSIFDLIDAPPTGISGLLSSGTVPAGLPGNPAELLVAQFPLLKPGDFLTARLDTSFVDTGFSTQTATVALGHEHQSVPEPTSTLSLLALGTLGAASTLKRKLKSSKSAEKETTKVG